MSVVSYFLDVLGTERWLNVYNTGSLWMRLSQKERQQRLHPGRHKERCWIILGDKRDGGDDGVAASAEVLKVFKSYLV